MVDVGSYRIEKWLSVHPMAGRGSQATLENQRRQRVLFNLRRRRTRLLHGQSGQHRHRSNSSRFSGLLAGFRLLAWISYTAKKEAGAASGVLDGESEGAVHAHFERLHRIRCCAGGGDRDHGSGGGGFGAVLSTAMKALWMTWLMKR